MKKNIIILATLLVIIFVPLIILGQTEVNYPSLPGVVTPQDLIDGVRSGKEIFPLFMNYLFQLLLVVSVIVAVLVVSYGGVVYMLSSNNPLKTRAARAWILSAVQGLLIVFTSYALLFTLDSQIVLFQLRGLKTTAPLEKVDLQWKIKNTYFQIPFGLLIEDAILNDNAQNKLYDVLRATQSAEANADAIMAGSQQLLSLVELCPQGSLCCSEMGIGSSSIPYSESNLMDRVSGVDGGLGGILQQGGGLQQIVGSSMGGGFDLGGLTSLLSGNLSDPEFLKQAVSGMVLQKIAEETGVNLGFLTTLSADGVTNGEVVIEAMTGMLLQKLGEKVGGVPGAIMTTMVGSLFKHGIAEMKKENAAAVAQGTTAIRNSYEKINPTNPQSLGQGGSPIENAYKDMKTGTTAGNYGYTSSVSSDFGSPTTPPSNVSPVAPAPKVSSTPSAAVAQKPSASPAPSTAVAQTPKVPPVSAGSPISPDKKIAYNVDSTIKKYYYSKGWPSETPISVAETSLDALQNTYTPLSTEIKYGYSPYTNKYGYTYSTDITSSTSSAAVAQTPKVPYEEATWRNVSLADANYQRASATAKKTAQEYLDASKKAQEAENAVGKFFPTSSQEKAVKKANEAVAIAEKKAVEANKDLQKASEDLAIAKERLSNTSTAPTSSPHFDADKTSSSSSTNTTGNTFAGDRNPAATPTNPNTSTTTNPAATPTNPNPSATTNPANSQDYWERKWGGKDSYASSQQQRYDEAIKTGDVDLQGRLEADAQRVGYDLEKPNQYSSGHEYYQENPTDTRTTQQKMADARAEQQAKLDEQLDYGGEEPGGDHRDADGTRSSDDPSSEEASGDTPQQDKGGENEQQQEEDQQQQEQEKEEDSSSGGGGGACPLISPPILAKIAELQSYVARLGQKASDLTSTKEPLKEDLYQLYKAVMIQSLGYRSLINYNSLLLERRFLKRDEVLIVTDTEKSTVGGYSWDWGQWVNNILYTVNAGGSMIKENDPATFYLKKPEADKIIEDALILAQEAKGISVTGTGKSAFEYEGVGSNYNYKKTDSGSDYIYSKTTVDVRENDIQEAGRNMGIERKMPDAPQDVGTTLFSPTDPNLLVVTSPFGKRTHPITGEENKQHNGIDLATRVIPDMGAPIYAAEDGEVVFAGTATGYGETIVIYHKLNNEGTTTYYAHLKKGSFMVKKGDIVKRGQHIAGMGTTGESTGVHLHFEVRLNSTKTPFSSGTPVDPAPYLGLNVSSAKNTAKELLSFRKDFFKNIARELAETFIKPVYAETDLEKIYNYFEKNNLDMQGVSAEELGSILQTLGINDNSSSGLNLSGLEINYLGDYMACGIEIPIGEAFEITWLHLVEILDTIDSYVAEAHNLMALQTAMNALAAPCNCPCIGMPCTSKRVGTCTLTCSKEAVSMAHGKVKESRQKLMQIAAHIELLTNGHFNTPTKNVCEHLNQDIRDEQERIVCDQGGSKLLSTSEIITRKLNYSRYEFDECITRPEHLEDVLAGKRSGKLPFFGPLAEEDGLSRLTKTTVSGNLVNTSNFNWFCCADTRFEDEEGKTIIRKDFQASPLAPTSSVITGTSITLKNISNGEYKIDNGSWQSSSHFSGLIPGKNYSFSQRYKETSTHYTSPASPTTNISTNSEMLEKEISFTTLKTTNDTVVGLNLGGTLVIKNQADFNLVLGSHLPRTSIDFNTEMVVVSQETGCGSCNSTHEIKKIIEKDEFFQIFVEKGSICLESGVVCPAVCTHPAHIIKTQRIDKDSRFEFNNVACVVVKKAQSSPRSLSSENATVTTYSVSFPSIPNGEYKVGSGEWQNAPVFSKLSSNTSYTFYQRYRETATRDASPAVSAVITTKKVDPLIGEPANKCIEPTYDLNCNEQCKSLGYERGVCVDFTSIGARQKYEEDHRNIGSTKGCSMSYCNPTTSVNKSCYCPLLFLSKSVN